MPLRSGNDFVIDVAELKGCSTPPNQLVLRRLFVPARRPAVFLAAVLAGAFFAAVFCGAVFGGAVSVGTDVSFAGVGWSAGLGA
jgi:hypothetical protein